MSEPNPFRDVVLARREADATPSPPVRQSAKPIDPAPPRLAMPLPRAIDITAAIPKQGLLSDYVDFGSAVTMAPPEFHLACALGIMSTMMGDRVVFSLGGRSHPTHLWILLLGQAGLAKKSSAITLGTTMLDDATRGRHRMPRDMTREALHEHLAEQPSGYIAWSEFLAFMGASTLSYMAGIKSDLCEIFDSPSSMRRKTKGGGPVEIKDPAVTILGAAVVRALSEWIEDGDLAGGFLSRFLFVPQVNEVEYIGMVAPDMSRRSELVARLEELSQDHALIPPVGAPPRVVTFPDAARKTWEVFDKAMMHDDETIDAKLSGFAGRAGLYAAKLAVCYAFAEGRADVNTLDVIHAAAFVKFAREQVTGLSEKEFGMTASGRELRKIEALLSAKSKGEWVSRNDMLRFSKLIKKDFDAYLATLIERGDVEEQEVPTSGRPRRDIRWVSGAS